MEKRMISILMAVIMLGMLLTGCGAEKKASSQDQEATETAESVDSQTVTELESGTVELKIWADSGSFDVLNILLDNFKQEYEGQANFDYGSCRKSWKESNYAVGFRLVYFCILGKYRS